MKGFYGRNYPTPPVLIQYDTGGGCSVSLLSRENSSIKSKSEGGSASLKGLKLPRLGIGKEGTGVGGGFMRNSTGYGAKNLAYGTPEIVKKIFTGQVSTDYFNNLCYGKADEPQGEFRYRSPSQREHPLWVHKDYDKLYWSANRHLVREVQDAHFRHKAHLRQVSRRGDLKQERHEAVRLKNASTMGRGMTAYLDKLGQQLTKYYSKKPKLKPKMKLVTIPTST